jgi:hypothetical protein
MCGKIASRGSSPACGLARPRIPRPRVRVERNGSIRSGEAMAGSSVACRLVELAIKLSHLNAAALSAGSAERCIFTEQAQNVQTAGNQLL